MGNKMRTIFYDFKGNVDLDLPSRRRLKKRLGDYDTLAEYTFCAIRDFEANWNEQCSFEEYVSAKAKLRDVNLRGGIMLPNHESALIKSFLVNSHAMLEDFIDQFRYDIRNLINKNFRLDDNEGLSKADKLIKGLHKIGIFPIFPEWLIPVLNYYRLVRNSVAHNEKEKDKCLQTYKEIDKSNLYSDYELFKGLAPNHPEALDLNDFYFYSACIKHFANFLTMSLKGKVIWEQLGSIHENFDVKKFKKGTKPIPLINMTLREYNHIVTKAEIESILAYIKEQKTIMLDES